MNKITIIGSGATGTLLAVNLIKNHRNEAIQINLVEKQERLGRGVAYSTFKDFHLLNVPANKMGAFPDDIEHFYKWLKVNNYNFFPNDFVPRRLYGEYLRELFNETLAHKTSNVEFNFLDDEAADIEIEDNQAKVFLKSGEILYSDKVVLAFGNFLPPHLNTPNQSYISAEKYFQNPWNEAIPVEINSTDDVLIIGTGLTMVDVAVSFYHGKHEGRIFAFSKHGWLPSVHELGFVYPSFSDELKDKTKISEIFAAVRRHLDCAKSQNSDWRAVLDSLRPVTQETWLNLPVAEKSRFMRHLRRVWDVCRHRIPNECHDVLEQMQDAGQLQVNKGKIKDITVAENGRFRVISQIKSEESEFFVDAVINCTGSECDFSRLDAPLVKNLLKRGLIKPDALNLGINALPDGRILNELNGVSDRIFAIGTALKGVLWESTAIPEIRTQANKLALSLIGR